MPPTTPADNKYKFLELRDATKSLIDEPAHVLTNPSLGQKSGHLRRSDLPINFFTRLLRFTTFQGIAVFVLTELYLFMLAVFHAHHEMSWNKFGVIAIVVNVAIILALIVESSPLRKRVEGKRLTFFVSLILASTLFFNFYLIPESRLLFIPFLFLVVAYGMYQIEQGSMMFLSFVIWLGYGAVTGIQYISYSSINNLWTVLLEWMVLAIGLSGFVMLAGKISRLHLALHHADIKLRYIEEHARRDPFLECYNRRYSVAALEDQKRKSDESGSPLCLAMIDLDHFKRINDEAGHLAGDEVLLTFSRLTQENIRQGDIFGRYGGEEFVLILPDTPLQAALALTERIREGIQNHCWKGKLHRTVTVSIGLTQYLKGESVLDFFSRTDAAMYLAKRKGRNKVEIGESSLD